MLGSHSVEEETNATFYPEGCRQSCGRDVSAFIWFVYYFICLITSLWLGEARPQRQQLRPMRCCGTWPTCQGGRASALGEACVCCRLCLLLFICDVHNPPVGGPETPGSNRITRLTPGRAGLLLDSGGRRGGGFPRFLPPRRDRLRTRTMIIGTLSGGPYCTRRQRDCGVLWSIQDAQDIFRARAQRLPVRFQNKDSTA